MLELKFEFEESRITYYLLLITYYLLLITHYLLLSRTDILKLKNTRLKLNSISVSCLPGWRLDAVYLDRLHLLS